MKKLFICISILLFALLLTACGGAEDGTTDGGLPEESTTAPVTTAPITTATTTEKPDPLAKIDPEVYEYSERKGDKYGVYINLQDISVLVIEETLKETTGYCASDYRFTSYDSVLLPRIKAELTQELGREPTEDELNQAVNKEIDAYNAARLAVSKELHDALHNEFLSHYSIPAEDILYRSSYTSTLILYATKEELELMAQNDTVISIGAFQNLPVTDA